MTMNTIIILLGAVALAYGAYILGGMLQRRIATNPIIDFQTPANAVAPRSQWADQTGEQIARRLPISLETWEDHLAWAHRGGKYTQYTIGRLVFMSLVLGGAGLIIPLMNPSLVTWMVPVLGFAAPFIWVKTDADKVRHRTVRQLPELASLVAAEISADTPPEDALVQASELPGPLSLLLSDAVGLSQRTNRPLLSHGNQRGTLREIFEQTGVPQLRAFAVQLDVASSKGVEVAERMTELSKTLAAEYRQTLMENTEKLENNLTTAVLVFYFAPMLGLILIPLFSEALKAF